MKVRNGFVSNSSSSSFIIALKGIPENDKSVIIEQYPFIEKYITLIEKTLFDDIMKTEEEFTEWFQDEYSWVWEFDEDEDHYYTKVYNACIDMIRKGYYITKKTVEYGDSDEELIEMIADKENFIVMHTGG